LSFSAHLIPLRYHLSRSHAFLVLVLFYGLAMFAFHDSLCFHLAIPPRFAVCFLIIVFGSGFVHLCRLFKTFETRSLPAFWFMCSLVPSLYSQTALCWVIVTLFLRFFLPHCFLLASIICSHLLVNFGQVFFCLFSRRRQQAIIVTGILLLLGSLNFFPFPLFSSDLIFFPSPRPPSKHLTGQGFL